MCVLDAAERFSIDLFNKLPVCTSLLYVRCKSYKGRSKTCAVEVKGVSHVQLTDVPRGAVVIVDTIVDTGATALAVRDWIDNHYSHPKIASLLVREGSENIPDYYGKVVPKGDFVIGYGLDYNSKYRNLDDIYTL